MLANITCIIRTLVANSEDCLQNPLLQFQNVAQLKRLMDSRSYSGPVSIGGNCTKVQARLTYSNDFGSHVLGSILPLEECEGHETEDIDKVIAHIKGKKVTASQTRAIMAKVQDHTSFSLENCNANGPLSRYFFQSSHPSSLL